MLVIGTVQLQLGLQGHAVRKAALEALLDRITRRVDIVVDELQNEIVSGIGNGKILLKHLIQPLVLTILGRGVHLEKIPERFKLYLQQVGIRHPVLDCRKANSLLCFCRGHR